ncbi:FliM/FliN family flagellar motor switch protein [Legionella maioricensis]|uniref:Flagellar motor switch protein FliN n=1 Tax=Legionella maioricensis TaxID=2896528 RepID=A0A9X2I9A5_9GAMM|nr:FliM/FliN family flagellar motor switch protein [Legionella maioricensis]MCL9682641.1 FliM/FliN family flagellar motor switch protein [Legionella maioricensis]MCL9687312.1 FliM/FliN family flagellar motor switch protein [Legionella maioricensis]
MSISVKKIALTEQQSQTEGQLINNNYLGLVGNIEVQCSVRIGTLHMTIAQLKQLKSEQVLSLEQKTNEPIELVLNDRVIARGELMSYEDNFAIQITEVTC